MDEQNDRFIDTASDYVEAVVDSFPNMDLGVWLDAYRKAIAERESSEAILIDVDSIGKDVLDTRERLCQSLLEVVSQLRISQSQEQV